MTANLDREMLDAMGAVVPSLHLRYLTSLGVSLATIAELSRHHPGLGVVRAEAGEEGLYHPADGGELHLVLPVYDSGELVDLVAFTSRAPEQWRLRTGCGWALGLDRGMERHTWADDTPLWSTPLEWLQHGANGLCVVDWDAPEVHYLADVSPLVCSTRRLAALLRGKLSRPVRLPEISVMEARLAA